MSKCHILSPQMLLIGFLALVVIADAADEWPQFRGPDGQGLAPQAQVPLTWSEKENVKWKTPIPGSGHSSPVISGKQIWLTTALENGKSLHVVCVDADTGKILHDVELFKPASPEFMQAAQNGYASPTPVLDHGRLYASFGTYGNACVDTANGTPVWKSADLMLNHDNNGPGSSPIVWDNLFILNCDGVDRRYVAALKTDTGTPAWMAQRSLPPPGGAANKAFSTPLVIQLDGKAQLISPASHRVSAYDPKTGAEIWYIDLPVRTFVPRPLYVDGLLYISGGTPKSELFAIKPGGSGALPKEAVVWNWKRQVPAVASPIVVSNRLYILGENGIGVCLDAKKGSEEWSERISGAFYSSPIFANGHLFFSSEEGKTYVIKPGDSLNIAATNTLDAGIMASPAVLNNALILRTKSHLYRIEK